MRFCDFSNISHKNIKIRARKFACRLETIFRHVLIADA